MTQICIQIQIQIQTLTQIQIQRKIQKQRGGEGPRWNLNQEICQHLIFWDIFHKFSSNDIRQKALDQSKSIDQQDLWRAGVCVCPPISIRKFIKGVHIGSGVYLPGSLSKACFIQDCFSGKLIQTENNCYCALAELQWEKSWWHNEKWALWCHNVVDR